MTGKTSIKRQSVPDSASKAALTKQELGMRRAVVPVTGAASEVVAKHGAKGTAFAGKTQIQIRRLGRSLASKGHEKETGQYGTSSRARALKGCKGKKACEFVGCVKEAMGHVPTNLQKACPGGA